MRVSSALDYDLISGIIEEKSHVADEAIQQRVAAKV